MDAGLLAGAGTGLLIAGMYSIYTRSRPSGKNLFRLLRITMLLVFGALISAVDPVATLSVLSSAEVNADPMLVSILFGESVLNDAIAIVLFQTLTQSSDGMPDSAADALAMVGRFAEMSICSTLLGVAVALLLALLLRHTQFYQQAVHLEISLTLGAAYVSYVGAEALGLSGVLSLFFCGIGDDCIFSLLSTLCTVINHIVNRLCNLRKHFACLK